MKKTEYQSNFTAGELSPRLYAHVDVDKYKNGLETATNVRILPHGPVVRRNGSQYRVSVKTASRETRLLRFQFNQDVAFILEFGHLYIRFIQDGAQVTSLGSPVEVTTTYTESELFDISYVQFGNTIYLAHPSHAPATLVYTSATSWALSDILFYPPATSEAGYKPALTLTPAATTGLGVNFTASGAVFLAGDVGRQLQNLGGRGKASIVSITSTTVVVADIIEDFPSTSAIASQSWKLDLSPVAKLTVDGTSLGETVTLQSYYTDSARGAAKTITGITAANPGVVTSASHGYSNGDKIEIKGVLGMVQVNNRVWTAKGVTANTFDLGNDENVNFDTTAYTTYVSGGTARKKFIDVGLDVFRAADVGTYVQINNGVGEVTAVTSARIAKIDMQKAMNASDETSNWSSQSVSWNATNGYPRCVGLHQQRIWFGGTTNEPQTIWGSETGIFDSLGVGSEDSDGLSLTLSTKEVNQINWMVGIRNDLAVGTSGAELTVNSGTVAGPITPTTASQQARSYKGSNQQQPVVIDNEILFINRSGRKINSFYYDFSIDNYKSDDLTFLAEHLTEDGIKELAYTQDPDSNIYAVTNGGELLVGTYLKDQKVIAWSKYTTDGSYESVQTLSTGLLDEVWVVVNRTINGSTVRYIEQFDFSTGEDTTDGFSDSYLVYSSPKTITGITKANPAVVTCTSHGYSNGNDIKIFDVAGMTEVNGHSFLVANVTANTFELTDLDGDNVNSTSYTTYVSGGEAHAIVNSVSGLSHLEGETVEVKTDGAAHPRVVVTSGAITLQYPSTEVVVGLPYQSVVKTLKKEYNIGVGTQQGQAVRWVRPILRLYKSAIPVLSGAFLPARTPTDLMDQSVPLFSGDAIYGPLDWSQGSQFEITVDQPFPMMLLGIFGSLDAGTQ